MEKIASFTIDHIKLKPGVYVSRKDVVGDQIITTFDLRMTSPNDEPVMNTAEVHTIEHLGATFLRNHKEFGTKTIYFGPMGCRTGFYLLTRNIAPERVLSEMVKARQRIVAHEGEVFGATRKECGNYQNLDITAAKEEAKRYLCALNGRVQTFKYEKEL